METTSIDQTTFYGRGIYLLANQNVAVDSIGWFGSLNYTGNYDVAIFAGQDELAALGPLLSVTKVFFVNANNTPQWNDISTSFTFQANNEYYVNFRRSDGLSDFADPFHYLSWGNGPQQADIGPFTLLDGRDGYAPNSNNNSWTTHFRMNTVLNEVPKPWPMLLFGTGIAGLTAVGRRRRK